MALLVWILASVLVVAGAKTCDVSQMNTCNKLAESLDFQNLDQACKALADVKSCLDNLKTRCPGLLDNVDSFLSGINQQYNTLCSTTGCSQGKFLKCTNLMSMESMAAPPTKETCKLIPPVLSCFEEVLASCPDGEEKRNATEQLKYIKHWNQICAAMLGGGGPVTPGQGGQACTQESIMHCQMLAAGAIAQTGPSDQQITCKAIGDSKACSESLFANCRNSPFADIIINATNELTNVWNMMCLGDCSAEMAKCSSLMRAEAQDESPTVVNCNSLMKAVPCLEALSSRCNITNILNSVYPQYQTCTQNSKQSSTVASTKPMGHKPTKPPGHSGKKPSGEDSVRQPSTKKPKGDHDHDHDKTEEDKDMTESKGMKHEDKKGLTAGDNENGSSLTTAYFLLVVTAPAIIAIMQGRF